MSSLIFYTDEKQALIATDTLATSPDGKPAFFTTKAFVIAHLQMIVCGIGVSGFLGRWFNEVNDRMVVHGIDNLDFHAPKILTSLWEKYKAEYLIPENMKITVYHFGFSEEDGTIHKYVYRSVSDFTSETLPYGTCVKPHCQPPENFKIPVDFKKMMDNQRSFQKSLPSYERVYIGGKIQIHHLTKDGFNIYTLCQFDDFKETQKFIFDNIDIREKGV